VTEYLMRAAGSVVCAALGAVSALYEAFGVIGGLPSMVLAFVGGMGLTHFAWFTVGTRWAPVMAIVPWLVVMVAAVSQRPEGDAIILGTSWVGALTAVLGMIGFAVPFFQANRARPRPLAPAAIPPAAPPA
jgi:hypothetical protein